MALPPQRPDLVVDLLQRAGGAADQDQVRAFPGVGQGDGAADAARGPGDEGETVGKALGGVHACLVSDPLGLTPYIEFERAMVSSAASDPLGLTPDATDAGAMVSDLRV